LTTKALALSITDLAKKDHTLLGLPISILARKAGLKVNDVYNKLLPALADKDLYEALKFADIGMKYAGIVDQNRLREEIGLEFIAAIDIIIGLVQEGLESNENHIKRKAMLLHGDLINEHAEKRRFIETITVESKMEELAKAKRAQDELKQEIIEYEEKNI